MSKVYNNVLLMIGNGFDLAAKLKSSYIDFYNEVIKESSSIKQANAFIDKYVGNSTISILNLSTEFKGIKRQFLNNEIDYWSLLFDRYKTKELESWYDIEKIIYDTLNRINFTEIRKYLKTSEKDSLVEPKLTNDENKIFALILYMNETKDTKSRPLYQELIDELYKFEKKFKNYMNKVLENHQDYGSNAKDILNKILYGLEKVSARELIDRINTRGKVYLYNFNYTKPFSGYYNQFEIKSNNIHGTLDTNIIFGVDHSTTNFDDDKNIFTKAYRKMMIDTTNNVEFILNKKIKYEVEVIKIFGLSLTEPDYTYFHTIFDFYDIYNSNIVLEFYYDVYDGRRKIKEDYVLSIYNLIKTYANKSKQEFDTKNNTLITKLIMENRLKIIDLKLSQK